MTKVSKLCPAEGESQRWVTLASSVKADGDIRDHLGAGRQSEAFELLLVRYQRKVFHLAWSMLGDETSAEEAAQDVFLRIWKALAGYRGEASLSTWIFAITRNQCLTRRKEIRANTASIEEPAVMAEVEARRRTGHSNAPANEPDVARMLAQLAPQYRQALTLFYLEEKSYEEVAGMLDVPIGTVRTYLHRGRKLLAESFAREAGAHRR